MKAKRFFQAFAAILLLLAAASWLEGKGVFDHWLARRQTRIDSLTLRDAAGKDIERARLVFERNGQAALTVEKVGLRLIFYPDPPPDDWGQGISTVRIAAFDCDIVAPVEVEVERRGSLLGNYSPHPVPLTRVYNLRVDASCPAPRPGGQGLESLIADLDRKEEGWARAALAEMKRIGPAAAPTVPVLIAHLEAPDDPERFATVQALRAIGPAALAALPALIGVLEDPQLRAPAAIALDEIARGSDELAAALVRAALEEKDPAIGERLLWILAHQGEATRRRAREIEAILEDPDRPMRIRMAAFGALRKTSLAESRRKLEIFAAENRVLLRAQGTAADQAPVSPDSKPSRKSPSSFIT